MGRGWRDVLLPLPALRRMRSRTCAQPDAGAAVSTSPGPPSPRCPRPAPAAPPQVLRVHYPGLESHPDHAIAAAQARSASAQCLKGCLAHAVHACLPAPPSSPGRVGALQRLTAVRPCSCRRRSLVQMSGFGGVVSFEVDGDLERTSRLVDSVQLPYMG